jgi:hypothetical protein
MATLLTTTISNSPTTGLARSLDVTALRIETAIIVMVCNVYSLTQQGSRINTRATPMYTVQDSATDVTLVDPATGIYLNIIDNNGVVTYTYDGGPSNGQPFTGTPVGEYTFLIGMLNTNVNIQTLISQYVTLNDSLGFYNV